MNPPIIRALTPADLPAWRVLRILMLETDPQGFYADLDQARARSDEEWLQAFPLFPDVILGLFAGPDLIGSCGFFREKAPKLAHKGQMWGVYVRPEFRRRGLGLEVVRAAIAHAQAHVDVLLTGASTAGAAIYKRTGFATYGVERDAYRVDGVALDTEMMALRFRAGPKG